MKTKKLLRLLNIVVIAFFLFLLLFLTNTEALSWNDKSRFSTIQNLVENKNFVINGAYYEKHTFDKVKIGGLFYSDKPPLLSVIASVPYFILDFISIKFDAHPKIATYTTNIFVMLLPYLFFCLFLYRYINNYTQLTKQKKILLSLALGVGTSMFAFATVMNNHIPAAVLVGFCSLYLFFTRKYNILGLIFTAFAFSLATFIDLGVVFIAVPFSIFMLVQLIKQNNTKKAVFIKILAYTIFALIPLVLHYFINSSITGDFWPASMHPEFFQYSNSPFTDVSLLTGVNLAVGSFGEYIRYAYHLTFGYRGFLLHDPLFVVGLIIALYYIITKKGKKRAYALTFLFSFIALFIYYSLFGKNAGGVSYSVRWFVIALPLIFPLIIDWASKVKKVVFYCIILFCFILSIIHISAAGNVISSTNRFKQRHSFINTTDNFPNYFRDQYSTWKKLIIKK